MNYMHFFILGLTVKFDSWPLPFTPIEIQVSTPSPPPHHALGRATQEERLGVRQRRGRGEGAAAAAGLAERASPTETPGGVRDGGRQSGGRARQVCGEAQVGQASEPVWGGGGANQHVRVGPCVQVQADLVPPTMHESVFLATP